MAATKSLLAVLAAAGLLVACSSDADNTANTAGAGAGSGTIRPGSQEDLVANVGDRVLFDTDRSNIRGDQRPVLERQARWMGQYPQVQVMVEGHADERGTREYNLALGERRAQAVERYFQVQGVAAGQMETISYGEERPADSGTTEAAYSLNRRVEMIK